MLNEPTLERLRALRLDDLLAAWTEQQKNAEIGSLAFDDRLGLLVDAEWMCRENKRIVRSLKEAKLRITEACVEAIAGAARGRWSPPGMRSPTPPSCPASSR